MSFVVLASMGLALLVLRSIACARPEQELKPAFQRLVQAGNYTWAEKQQTAAANGVLRKALPRASGETEIGGYTTAQIGPIQAVMLNRDSAFGLQQGWRYSKDLGEDDIAELRARRAGFASTPRSYVHPLPHELLSLLMPAAPRIQKVSGVLVADLDPAVLDAGDVTTYLNSGRLPRAELPMRNVLGLPTGRGAGKRPAGPRSDEKVKLYVWIEHGEISRLSVEFLRRTTFLNGPRTGDEDVLRAATIMELSQIGTTRVTVPPEARALFLDAKGGR